MRKTIIIGLTILAFFILQTSVFKMLKLADTVPNVMLILISSTALMRGQKAGMMTGFFSGLLMDLFFSRWLGAYALLYLLFGFVDGFFNRIYYTDDNFLPLILIGANDLIYGLIMYIVFGLLRNHLHFFYYLTSIILPELVYTIAVGLVLYQLLLRLFDILSRFEEGSADIV